MKTLYKKFMIIAISAIIAFGLTACGGGGSGDDDDTPGTYPDVDTDMVTITIKQTDSVQNIQKAIQDALDYAAADGSDPDVIVKGTKTNADKKLSLEFKSGWTDLLFEADYTGPGLELKAGLGKMGEFGVTNGGSIVLNGDLIIECDINDYLGLYTRLGGTVTVNGSVFCDGDAKVYAFTGGIITITGNVTGVRNFNCPIFGQSGGSVTVNGNVTSDSPRYAISISGGSVVLIKGNVSATNGYLAFMHGAGSLLTIDGTVTVKDASTSFISIQTSTPPYSTVEKPQSEFSVVSDKSGYDKYSDGSWVVYIRE